MELRTIKINIPNELLAIPFGDVEIEASYNKAWVMDKFFRPNNIKLEYVLASFINFSDPKIDSLIQEAIKADYEKGLLELQPEPVTPLTPFITTETAY